MRSLLSFLTFAAPALAQSIFGTLFDPSDAPVPATKITLQQGRNTRTTQTGANGDFRFDRLTATDYEIRVDLQNFQPLRVAAKPSPLPVSLKLTLADLSAKIDVEEQSGKVNTDSSENLNAVSIQRADLDNLPSLGQDYVATLSRFLDAGSVATGGVSLIVDGVEATKAGVSASAIQEIKINNNPYSSEFSRPGRSRIEIITKAGSEQYHGEANFVFRDQHLNGREAFALTRPAEQRRIYEGSLIGPLVNGKTTSFLLTFDHEANDFQAIVYANTPSGIVQGNIPTPNRVTESSAKITHQFNDKHTVFWQFTTDNRESKNLGIGGVVLPEAASNYNFHEEQLIVNHRWIVTPKLLSQFRILFADYAQNTTSVSQAPRIVVPDSFTGGGAQADILRTEVHTAYNWIFTYSAGKHTIKFGMNVPDWSRRGLRDLTNRLGTYSFSSLSTYNALRPFSLVLQQGNPHTVFIEKVLGGFVQDEWLARPNLTISLGLRYDWQNYFHDHNNFSPRIGFAYAPTQNRKTVVRGGIGFFYDRTGPAIIYDLLRYDGRNLNRYLLSDPQYPQSPLPSTTPSSVTRLDPQVRIPYSIQYSIGAEQQLTKKTTLAINYIGNRAVGTFRSRDANAPLGPFYLSRPDPTLNVLRQIESAGRQRSDTFELTLRGRVSKYFSGVAQYNFSHSYNNTAGIAYQPANSYDWSQEWGRSDLDRRQVLNLLGTFTFAKWLKLGVALQMQSGAAYSQTTGRDTNNDGLALERPIGVARNTLQGPGYLGLDLRWARDFNLTKKAEKGLVLTTAIDFFNVLNHVNYINFVGNLSSPFYGQPVSSQPARRGQLALRLRF